MRNVTVSLADELVRWARVWAAEHETSISAMLSQILKEKMEKETRYLSSMNDFLSMEARELSDGSAYPSRESLYER
ncbi:MAG: CopG family transcriptional regulator [Spirochaetae bacterium HGW-Spirochaetae-7]|jgi:plasmid stability protein|nr:MAG: CopG family transcriptional regulator [Spirochaetae bacterium HGW-Spirochaetae-7]